MPAPFRNPLPSGSEPNQVVNPKAHAKPRSREFGREGVPRGGRAALSVANGRTLDSPRIIASRCATCGKDKTPRAETLGFLSKPWGRRKFRKPNQLPVQDSLREMRTESAERMSRENAVNVNRRLPLRRRAAEQRAPVRVLIGPQAGRCSRHPKLPSARAPVNRSRGVVPKGTSRPIG